MINDNWHEAVRRRERERASGVDPFGFVDDVYGCVCEDGDDVARDAHAIAPPEWFWGRYRGLLSPNLVATIDQLLFAATRTKFVALRFAGLAGKVVVIDEVHAADDYMAEFLRELLWWLGSLKAPVVLLSATLFNDQRDRLVEQYVKGAERSLRTVSVDRVGYPQITTAALVGDAAELGVHVCESSREARAIALDVATGLSADADEAMA
ncbi:MAG TPA: hypothetical protein PLV68_02410, partial [Ilumatobacteraceae bacterium]|nr:hypothetical protein [Ilumatobacteraceae bacterium]